MRSGCRISIFILFQSGRFTEDLLESWQFALERRHRELLKEHFITITDRIKKLESDIQVRKYK